MTAKRKRGRPADGGEHLVARMIFRVSPNQLERYTKAAEATGGPLGTWAREALDEKLDRQMAEDE